MSKRKNEIWKKEFLKSIIKKLAGWRKMKEVKNKKKYERKRKKEWQNELEQRKEKSENRSMNEKRVKRKAQEWN